MKCHDHSQYPLLMLTPWCLLVRSGLAQREVCALCLFVCSCIITHHHEAVLYNQLSSSWQLRKDLLMGAPVLNINVYNIQRRRHPLGISHFHKILRTRFTNTGKDMVGCLNISEMVSNLRLGASELIQIL